MRLLKLPGVFAPISDSWMLANRVMDAAGPGSCALDLCTGSGVVAVAAATAGADVTAVDVSRRALATAFLNARRRGTRVAVRRGHLFQAVPGRRFDVISANPPYVPSPSPVPPKGGLERAWAAGLDGRLVLDEICDRAASHLNPGGVLLLVHSSIIGEQSTVDRLRSAGFSEVSVIDRHTGALGPLMLAQQHLGTIPADLVEEDVIVVRAVVGPA